MRNVTGRRLLAAFGGVLLLFAVALAVELVTLRRIADAESEVARLDAAKHAGHMAAAQVREQYIHQAHTLIEFDDSHLGHYDIAARETRAAIAHLQAEVESSDRPIADEIAALAEREDAVFRTSVVPTVRAGDHSHVATLGDDLEVLVDRVVDLNAQLNAALEARSAVARTRAAQLGDQARATTVACFALAIVLAAALGFVLTRTIVRRVERLRDGARRIGAGDLSARIGLAGTDELAELGATFDQMAASLADNQAELIRTQKLASIGQVAAGIAHELNNPLAVILGYAKVLRGEGAHADELAIIDDEARQCQRIVAGLLDLARPQQLEVRPIDLGELAREAVDRLADAGALADRAVEVTSAEPVVVAADAGRIRQVIANVVTNAVEATEPSGKITIAARMERDGAVLTIADDGRGVAPEISPRLFDPFVTTKANGTGLGLAIAHAIVDAHGGSLSVTSSPGSGTSVALRLPRRDHV